MKIKSPLLIMVTAIMFGIIVSSVAYAVDEDYFIPYTDNYGYEYDPETGTYIKKEPPPDSQSGPGSLAAKPGNNLAADTGITPGEVAVDSEDTGMSYQLPVLVLSLAGILVLTIVVARTLKKET